MSKVTEREAGFSQCLEVVPGPQQWCHQGDSAPMGSRSFDSHSQVGVGCKLFKGKGDVLDFPSSVSPPTPCGGVLY